jgi:hypothetical protein
MITAEKLRELISYTRGDLARILRDSGYTGCSFQTAEFLGITNGGDFCYKVTYWDDGGGPDDNTLAADKVFVKYSAGTVTADF